MRYSYGVTRLLAFLVLALMMAAPAAAQGTSVAVLPVGDGGAVDAFYFVDLANGEVALVDRLRRAPTEGRVERVGQNLFAAVGRPAGPAAPPGEIHLLPIHDRSRVEAAVFVEASTGYLAYFEDLGKKGQLGKIKTAIGRPFGPIATADGRYVVLPRRVRGSLAGAYVYHTPTGRGLYFPGLGDLAVEAPVASTSPLPQLEGEVTAAPLDDSGFTVGYLLFSDLSGEVHRLELHPEQPELVLSRQLDLDLWQHLPAEAPRPVVERLTAVALRGGEGITRDVVIVDAGSGQALLLSEADTGRPRPTLLPIDLSPLLLGGGPRHLAAVPRADGDGVTVGVWLLDSLTRNLLYLHQPQRPGESWVDRVSLERR